METLEKVQVKLNKLKKREEKLKLREINRKLDCLFKKVKTLQDKMEKEWVPMDSINEKEELEEIMLMENINGFWMDLVLKEFIINTVLFSNNSNGYLFRFNEQEKGGVFLAYLKDWLRDERMPDELDFLLKNTETDELTVHELTKVFKEYFSEFEKDVVKKSIVMKVYKNPTSWHYYDEDFRRIWL